PMLFMGEEWAAQTPFAFFTSHPEPELGRATANGRRAEFADHGWDGVEIPDPQDPQTFRSSKLDWSEMDQSAHRRMFDFYRELIELRKREHDLRRGDFASVTTSFDDAAGWFAMARGEWIVIGVLAGTKTTVPVDLAPELWWDEPAIADGALHSSGHNVVIGRTR
ncbi:DUF3459 domain-containing protein, partial [Streptomyces sp. SID10244]|nr:DUF3459 domain-containing protein [Streptomyces sp. SID10244]